MSELRKALEGLLPFVTPLRMHPVGAPGSPARLEQKAQIAAVDVARAALKAHDEELRWAAKLADALEPLIDPDECWFDHDGFCQAHTNELDDGRCANAVAKETLQAWKDANDANG